MPGETHPLLPSQEGNKKSPLLRRGLGLVENMRRNIIPYNPKLKELARKLRTHSTLAEIALWNELKGKKVLGFDFHRQKPIDNYIVDFYCPNLLLAIEIDGNTHEHEFVYQNDRVRQKRLESIGITILRFTDEEVKKNREGVIMALEDWIRTHSVSKPTHITHPYPLLRGE